MSGDRCDVCGREVPIAGGIANFWTMDHTETGGLSLEFESDDTEHFLCFDCIEDLPDDPTADDVRALRAERRGDGADGGEGRGDGDTRGEDRAE